MFAIAVLGVANSTRLTAEVLIALQFIPSSCLLMFRLALLRQLQNTWHGLTWRSLIVATVAVLGVVTLATSRQSPILATEAVATTQLLAGLLVGGFLTGWRVAQFPKSRAAEVQLLAPVSDWVHVGGELAAGMIRTAIVLMAITPMVVGLVALGWLRPGEATVLVALPIIGGWLAGLLLAVIAYEPVWVRRLLERGFLVFVLVYLVSLGLFGQWFVPRLLVWWDVQTSQPAAPLAITAGWFSYLNPFRLLSAAGDHSGNVSLTRLAAVAALLLAISGLCLYRLVRRLRPHYDEFHFAARSKRGGRSKRLGNWPLSWWTAHRVGQFKGRVNLYLAWATIGLYGGWLIAGENWPAWLATGQLRVFAQLGGQALLATAALQLAVVGLAFLNGLWDSNTAQRVGRLELLLVTQLEARDYLRASIVAAWTRGRGYVLGVLAMWVTSAVAAKLTWSACLGLVWLAGAYLVLSMGVAFRNFARLPNDRAVGLWGLGWSVGMPVLTVALFQFDLPRLAAVTPLGAVFLASMPPQDYVRLTLWSPTILWTMALLASIAWTAIGLGLITSALRDFDAEIRDWFETQLAGPSGRPAADVRQRARRIPRRSGATQLGRGGAG